MRLPLVLAVVGFVWVAYVLVVGVLWPAALRFGAWLARERRRPSNVAIRRRMEFQQRARGNW